MGRETGPSLPQFFHTCPDRRKIIGGAFPAPFRRSMLQSDPVAASLAGR
jgi:hypothetical protein